MAPTTAMIGRRAKSTGTTVLAGASDRAFVNAGYMKFSKRQNWFPF